VCVCVCNLIKTK